MATLAERFKAFRNPEEALRPLGTNEIEVGRVVVKREPGGGPRVALRPSALAGQRARLTQETAASGDLFGSLWGMAARPDREVDWRAPNLDAPTPDRIATAPPGQMMADLSPGGFRDTLALYPLLQPRVGGAGHAAGHGSAGQDRPGAAG